MLTLRRSLIAIILVGTITLLSQVSIYAFHSFDVPAAVVCTDGAVILGRPTTAGSLGLTMTSQIMSGGIVVASGNTHTFTTIGENFAFTVNYPVGTVAVGASVLASISDIPGTDDGAQGDFLTTTVGDCSIAAVAPYVAVGGRIPLDNRINRFDAAAPFAVYAVGEGLEIYVIDSEGEGELTFSVSADAIAAVGIPDTRTLIAEHNGITVSRDSDGQFVMTAPMANGKTYVLFFEFVGVLTPYTSYETE
jgi:hypothetical protein